MLRSATRLALPLLLLLTVAVFGNLLRGKSTGGEPFHDKDFYHGLRVTGLDSLVDAENRWFFSAGRCDYCHGEDPAMIALVDASGNDINPVDDWRSTMMANSARDPFWRAQVSHEVLTNPGLQSAIEDKCASCHAPIGRYSHQFETGQAYAIAQLANDSLGMDGVTCVACHSQRPDSLGYEFSGTFHLDTAKTIYGPYPGPINGPMFTELHASVVYGPHVQASELCASCHTLITETVDLQGNLTGSSFAEQATYHEWLNSSFYQNDETCQSCHMPEVNDQVYLSFPHVAQTPTRSPFRKHHFAGANVFMLRMLKDYADSLEIAAKPEEFDSTIARTERLLQQEALSLSFAEEAAGPDSLGYLVFLENLAGHKLPSGYPSRRMFVEFVALKNNGDTLFSSGTLGPNGELVGQNPAPAFEPHYEVITSQQQVQIYEHVMGDVNGNVTTTLTRAASHLKDNRLLPRGFKSGHPAYDTMQVAGAAVGDPEYLVADPQIPATGQDELRYRFPLNGYTGTVSLQLRVWYQTVRPAWMDETFGHSSPEIDRFERWFDAADHSPVLMAELSEADLLVGQDLSVRLEHVRVYPNPTSTGRVRLLVPDGRDFSSVEVFDLQGRRLARFAGADKFSIPMPPVAGTYLLIVRGEGWSETHKVISR